MGNVINALQPMLQLLLVLASLIVSALAYAKASAPGKEKKALRKHLRQLVSLETRTDLGGKWEEVVTIDRITNHFLFVSLGPEDKKDKVKKVYYLGNIHGIKKLR
jgi:hypothetical protein